MRYWIYLALAMMGAVGVVAAQTTVPIDTMASASSRVAMGLQLGYFNSSGADQGAFYFGAAAQYRIGSMLGFEATLGYWGQQAFDFGKVSGNDLSANVTSIPLMVSVMVFIPLRSTSFVPYLLGGGGLYLLTIDYSADINKVMGDQTATKAGAQLGFGADLPLTQSVIARADYRYLFISQVFESGSTFDFSSKKYGGGAFSLGFVVLF
jgi:opacity protein-like surface antigen